MKLTSKMLQIKKSITEEAEEIDFNSGDISKLSKYINNKIDMKSPNKKSDLYSELVYLLMRELKDVPSGEVKLRKILKDFKAEWL